MLGFFPRINCGTSTLSTKQKVCRIQKKRASNKINFSQLSAFFPILGVFVRVEQTRNTSSSRRKEMSAWREIHSMPLSSVLFQIENWFHGEECPMLSMKAGPWITRSNALSDPRSTASRTIARFHRHGRPQKDPVCFGMIRYLNDLRGCERQSWPTVCSPSSIWGLSRSDALAGNA